MSDATPPSLTTLGNLVVAGAGAAGSSLALALTRRGMPIVEVACRTAQRAAECSQLLGGRPLTLDQLCEADRPAASGPVLLLVSVPDRSITGMAEGLARRTWPPGSVALHLSGSVEVSALASLEAAGLATGGLHPLKSFVDPLRDANSFAGTVFALEGSPSALAAGKIIASRLNGRALRLPPGSRPAWHAAASHACNHLVSLLDQALDLMQVAGLERDVARAALLPLLQGTLHNLEAETPGQALTGPVVRGDLSAVAAHLTALKHVGGDVGQAYRALATRAVKLAREHRGLDDAQAESLLASLRSP